MNVPALSPDRIAALRRRFGARIRENAPLAPYTSARIGGPADFLLAVRTAAELRLAAEELWESQVPFRVLGGGSNILVSDAGVRCVVLLNQAHTVRFSETQTGFEGWAESGAGFGLLGRRAAERGLSGLEWAATIPGTVGGAVVGNAGAHGGEVAQALILAEILQPGGRLERWSVDRMAYAYRDSWLKRNPGAAVVLTATFRLKRSTKDKVKTQMAEYQEYRQRTQPAGASWGSMFKNPPSGHAGRLIDEAGLKGFQVGQAQVSSRHANFFINLGEATAADVRALIEAVRARVAERHNVALELEIELVGDWAGVLAEPGEGIH